MPTLIVLVFQMLLLAVDQYCAKEGSVDEVIATAMTALFKVDAFFAFTRHPPVNVYDFEGAKIKYQFHAPIFHYGIPSCFRQAHLAF
jgi:hypothetical protein